MSTAIAVGQPAPDFTLTGWAHGEASEYTLSARRGQPVVLAFYPVDGSTVCTKQMCNYSQGVDVFAELDAIVWGISARGIDSKKDFAVERKLQLPLLADEGHAVAAAYGVHSKLGTKRSVFIVDAGGNVAWSHIATLGITYQNTDKIADVLRSLS